MTSRVRFPRSYAVTLDLNARARGLSSTLKSVTTAPSRFTLRETSEFGAWFTRPVTWSVWGASVDVAFDNLGDSKTLAHVTWRPRFYPQLLGVRQQAESDVHEISQFLKAAADTA